MIKDNDEIIYYLKYDKDCKEISITVVSPETLTPDEFLLALSSFVVDAEADAQNLFNDDFAFQVQYQ